MQNKIFEFRRMMAEQGVELTIDQAKKAYNMAGKFMKSAKKVSVAEIWSIQSVEGLTQKEKDDIVRLYQFAKEL
jgi:hypothetical protein